MDVREKLVDLIKEGIRKGLRANGDDRLDYSFEDVADYLLDSGVTVQEWIPVAERLPEFGERVICTDGHAVFEQYRAELSCVYGMWDRCGLRSPMQEVTHWMPLPAPPEE